MIKYDKGATATNQIAVRIATTPRLVNIGDTKIARLLGPI